MISVSPAPMPIADYCNAFLEKTIRVNRDYQRSWEVWPDSARSFLIESIILGFPVPKFSLHQVLDLRSRKTVKEIVDGQQRTAAIFEFFSGDLRLSRRLETDALAGRTYEELDSEHQQSFLSYSLSIDLFVGATEAQIREVFRRMNSYTVPLNPEEERHATYQGEFKWYIYKLAKNVEAYLGEAGVFSQREFVRMQDAKLLTEITHALQHGIRTTNKAQLNRIYKDLDADFPEAEEYSQRIGEAFQLLGAMEDLHQGPLMKSYIVYSLVLAVLHVMDPVARLQSLSQRTRAMTIAPERAMPALLRLAQALEQREDAPPELRSFVDACLQRTNVGEQRSTRFSWLLRALTGELPSR